MDQKEIAKYMNEYYTSVATELVKKLPKSTSGNNFRNYLTMGSS